jgi:hypothetical protein
MDYLRAGPMVDVEFKVDRRADPPREIDLAG